jgi:hypothetical protein
MLNFRKKPVVIEAMQYRGPDTSGEVEYMLSFDKWLSANQGERICRHEANGLVIPTLEGDHLASPGDWIIKGVQGELYPCKPDIFAATYEPA